MLLISIANISKTARILRIIFPPVIISSIPFNSGKNNENSPDRQDQSCSSRPGLCKAYFFLSGITKMKIRELTSSRKG